MKPNAIRPDVREMFDEPRAYHSKEVAPAIYGSPRSYHEWLDAQPMGLFTRGARNARLQTRLQISRTLDRLEQCVSQSPVANREAYDVPDWLDLIPASIPDAFSEAVENIYIFECGDFSKIGMSKNVGRRMDDIKRSAIAKVIDAPVSVYAVYSIVGDYSASVVELALHKVFLDKHYKGDWFSCPGVDIEDFLLRSGLLTDVGAAL